jgi:hypothetical protein
MTALYSAAHFATLWAKAMYRLSRAEDSKRAKAGEFYKEFATPQQTAAIREWASIIIDHFNAKRYTCAVRSTRHFVERLEKDAPNFLCM